VQFPQSAHTESKELAPTFLRREVAKLGLQVPPTIDDDFLKLVIGRGEIRVWLSCASDPESAKQHIADCKEQVRRFTGTLPGDVYVFIIFDWAEKGVKIERFTALE